MVTTPLNKPFSYNPDIKIRRQVFQGHILEWGKCCTFEYVTSTAIAGHTRCRFINLSCYLENACDLRRVWSDMPCFCHLFMVGIFVWHVMYDVDIHSIAQGACCTTRTKQSPFRACRARLVAQDCRNAAVFSAEKKSVTHKSIPVRYMRLAEAYSNIKWDRRGISGIDNEEVTECIHFSKTWLKPKMIISCFKKMKKEERAPRKKVYWILERACAQILSSECGGPQRPRRQLMLMKK